MERQWEMVRSSLDANGHYLALVRSEFYSPFVSPRQSVFYVFPQAKTMEGLAK